MGDGIEPVIVDSASVNEILTRQAVHISDQRPGGGYGNRTRIYGLQGHHNPIILNPRSARTGLNRRPIA